jgi:hypothetical protein
MNNNKEIKIIVLASPNRHGHKYEVEYPGRILGRDTQESLSCNDLETLIKTVRERIKKYKKQNFSDD